MPKYTILDDAGKNPILEFDSEKENPHFYEMLRIGWNVLQTLNTLNQNIPQQSPNIASALFLFSKHLSNLNNAERKLQKEYTASVKPIVNKIKNFIINPKVTVTHGVFAAQFNTTVLSQAQLLAEDIERTYDRIMNRCLAIRADLLSRLSLALGVLSVVLGFIGAISIFR
jgi:hypothetical protein